MKKLTPELIAKAKAAKSAEELLALAKENSVEITEEEAKTYFAQLNANGAVSDDELDAVAGGGLFGLSCPDEDGDETDNLRYSESDVVGRCPMCGCTDLFIHTDPLGEKFIKCRKCMSPVPNAKRVRAL